MSEFEGIDTETIKGYARILGTSQTYINMKCFDDFINLVKGEEYKDKIFMYWNLRFDVQAIIKHLLKENEDTWRKIAMQIQTFEGYKYEDYKLTYIPNKLFSIKTGNRVIKFYDIAQFYEWGKLDIMAKQYLGKQKIDSSGWIEQTIKYSHGKISYKQLEGFFYKYNKEIGKYCQLDASLTKDLTYFMKASFKALNYPFERPLSSAKLVELYILRNYQYPRISDATNKTHEFVRQSFHGGIFESRIRGVFNQSIYEYDINSAYPNEMSTLDHMGNGKLWKVEKPTNKANMGWYICVFDSTYIPYKKEIPYYITIFFKEYDDITVSLSDSSSFYCEGVRKQIITKIEYDFLKRHNIKVDVLGGIEWYKESDKYESPFCWIEKAYEQRRDIKQENKKQLALNPNYIEDMREKTLKKMYNSAYGKTAQQKHGFSKITNFFYASYITAGCRVKVAEETIKRPDKIIEIATDGIYSTEKIKGLSLSNELGDWEYKEYEKGLFLGSGMKQLFTDKNKYHTKIRGITNDSTIDLIGLLKEHKKQDKIMFWKERPIHLNECLMQIHKKSLDDLNDFQSVGRQLSVNTDKKHQWSKHYKNFGELLRKKSYQTPFTVMEVDEIYNEYTLQDNINKMRVKQRRDKENEIL